MSFKRTRSIGRLENFSPFSTTLLISFFLMKSLSNAVWAGQEPHANFTEVIVPVEGEYEIEQLPIASVAVHPRGNYLAAGALDGTLRIWDMESCKLEQVVRVQWPYDFYHVYIPAVAFSPDGRWLVAGARDWAIRIWGNLPYISTAEKVKFIAHEGDVRVLAYSPDGRYIASGGEDGKVRLWNIEAEYEEEVALMASKGFVFAVTFSPDSRYLIFSGVVNDKSVIRLWNINERKENVRFATTPRVRGLAVSPDGKLLAAGIERLNSTAEYEDPVIVWEIQSGREMMSLNAHEGGANAVSFSPDGKTLASGGEDGTVKLWNVQNGGLVHTMKIEEKWNKEFINGHEYEVLNSGGGDVQALEFTSDGQYLVSAGYGQNPRLWDPGTGKLLKMFLKKGCEILGSS